MNVPNLATVLVGPASTQKGATNVHALTGEHSTKTGRAVLVSEI